jgi:hypothetical protein
MPSTPDIRDKALRKQDSVTLQRHGYDLAGPKV